MKKQTALIILGVVGFYAVIYFAGQKRNKRVDLPTLSSLVCEPNSYLKNVEYYEEQERHNQSAFNLEEAIQSNWELEKDVDEASFKKLQNAIKWHEAAHKSIIRDSQI